MKKSRLFLGLIIGLILLAGLIFLLTKHFFGSLREAGAAVVAHEVVTEIVHEKILTKEALSNPKSLRENSLKFYAVLMDAVRQDKDLPDDYREQLIRLAKSSERIHVSTSSLPSDGSERLLYGFTAWLVEVGESSQKRQELDSKVFGPTIQSLADFKTEFEKLDTIASKYTKDGKKAKKLASGLRDVADGISTD